MNAVTNGSAGCQQQIAIGAGLNDSSFVQQRDLFREKHRFAQIVRDQQHGLAQALKDGFQFLLQAAPNERIQRRHGFIEQHHLQDPSWRRA